MNKHMMERQERQRAEVMGFLNFNFYFFLFSFVGLQEWRVNMKEVRNEWGWGA